MLLICILYLKLLLTSIIFSRCNAELSIEQLQEIQQKIQQFVNETAYIPKTYNGNNILEKSCFAYKNNTFIDFIRNEPILVYGLYISSWHGFGNRIGEYFEAISTANHNHLHFIAYTDFRIYEQSDDNSPRDPKSHSLTNIHSDDFTLIIQHPNPMERTKENEQFPCVAEFPWQGKGLWTKNIDQLTVVGTKIYQKFSNEYKSSKHIRQHEFQFLQHHNSSSLMSHEPSVTIHFRCQDILFNTGMYGFNNFNIYPQIIPSEVDSIVIMTEKENNNARAGQICSNLTTALGEHLKNLYPLSNIAIHRGHVRDALALMYKSKILICPPSTLSFFVALCKTSGRSYFPRTQLISSAQEVYFRDNFFWFTFPKVEYIYELRADPKFREDPELSSKIIKILKTINPPSFNYDKELFYRDHFKLRL